MKNLRPTYWVTAELISVVLAPMGCAESDSTEGGSGGATASGGAAAAGGTGATGGTNANVGGATVGGGMTSTGGAMVGGGATATGGMTAMGGTAPAGGTTASGGTTSTGGTAPTGGTTATGGAPITGGAGGTGGASGSGGGGGVGGHLGTGGDNSTGGVKTPGTAQPGDITVDPATEHQTMDGFGIADVWQAQSTSSEAQRALFSNPVDGIGMTILRVGIETDGRIMGDAAFVEALPLSRHRPFRLPAIRSKPGGFL